MKIYLVSNKQRITKKKTHVKKRTLNPVFNESFVFDLPKTQDSSLDNIQVVRCLTRTKILKQLFVQLEFVMLDWDRVTKNEVTSHSRQLWKSERCYQILRVQINPQVIGKLELGREGSEGSQLHHWTEIQVSYFSPFFFDPDKGLILSFLVLL